MDWIERQARRAAGRAQDEGGERLVDPGEIGLAGRSGGAGRAPTASGTAIWNRPFPSNTSPVTAPPDVGSSSQIFPDSKVHVAPSTVHVRPPAGTATGSARKRHCWRRS